MSVSRAFSDSVDGWPAGELGKPHVLPVCRTLPGFAELCRRGIAIESLPIGTTVWVRTRNSEYRLFVLDNERRTLLIKGGSFHEWTHACLEGSSAGGSALKIGWLGVGLRMELLIGRQKLVTSRVMSIVIDERMASAVTPDH